MKILRFLYWSRHCMKCFHLIKVEWRDEGGFIRELAIISFRATHFNRAWLRAAFFHSQKVVKFRVTVYSHCLARSFTGKILLFELCLRISIFIHSFLWYTADIVENCIIFLSPCLDSMSLSLRETNNSITINAVCIVSGMCIL